MATSMPWIKIYTEMLDDHKMRRLETRVKWRFVELLLLAGECDSEGYIVNGDDPLTLEDIAWRVRSTVEEIQEDIEQLIHAGLIEVETDGAILIINFSSRQGRSQAQKREMWRERQKKSRKKAGDSQDETESVTGESPVTDRGVTPLEERREEERRGESEKITNDFETMRGTLQESLGLLSAPSERDIQAIKEMIQIGATKEDINGAIEFFKSNAKVARSPAHILESVKYQVRKRCQKTQDISIDEQLELAGYTPVA